LPKGAKGDPGVDGITGIRFDDTDDSINFIVGGETFNNTGAWIFDANEEES